MAKTPETEMPWPASPSVMPRSAAMGVRRLTGRNSEATRVKVISAMQMTGAHPCKALAPRLS